MTDRRIDPIAPEDYLRNALDKGLAIIILTVEDGVVVTYSNVKSDEKLREVLRDAADGEIVP